MVPSPLLRYQSQRQKQSGEHCRKRSEQPKQQQKAAMPAVRLAAQLGPMQEQQQQHRGLGGRLRHLAPMLLQGRVQQRFRD
jgi:hypothetical protein